MFSHQHYVPLLKWKQGEYQALYRLVNSVKDGITPLIEVPAVGFDHEAGEERETIDSHLGDFGRRLRSKWQARTCFVDMKYIDPATRMAGGQHFLEALFDLARAEGCSAIPVISLNSDDAYLAATARIVITDRRGACLRLAMADFDRPNLMSDIAGVLTRIGIGYPDTDLVIDLAAPNFQPINAFVRTLEIIVGMVPVLNRWRTFTLAGTAYPPSIAGLRRPFDHVPRYEWIAYRTLVSRLGSGNRIPTFGDYAVAHPDPVELDMRLIKPFAKLRYTFDDHWHIGRGDTVRTHGFGQYQQLCADLMAQAYFSGHGFSAGDAYIADCVASAVPTGNLTTWVWVSTNRHLTKVVADLATFHGLSAAA